MGFTLSATAPEFHPNDEELERSNLSAEELANVREDVFNEIDLDKSARSCYIEETNQMQYDGIQAMKTYIENSINKIQKKAYEEAIEKHPNLVAKESDPLAFLRCERYDPEAAAIRLVEYWKQRKSLFGQNAYKEMSLLQGSALTEEDMNILYKGHLMVLPKNAAGHAVLFYNGAPNEELPRNSVLRVWFYLLHVVTRNDDHVQRDGFIIINSIKGFNLSKHYDRVLGKKAYEIVKSAMPAQIRSSHAIVGKSMPTIQVVAPSSKQMAGKHIRLRAVTHTGSNQEMILSLSQYGFVSHDIPSDVIGGGYTRGHFLQWISKQRDLEQQQQSQQQSSSSKILLKSNQSEGEGTTTSSSATTTTTDESSSLSSTEESEEGGGQRVSCWTGSNNNNNNDGMCSSSQNNNNNNNEHIVVDDHVKDSYDNNKNNNKKKLEEEEDDDDVVAVAVASSSNRYNIQNDDDYDDYDEINNNNNNETSSSFGMITTTSSKGADIPAFYVLRC